VEVPYIDEDDLSEGFVTAEINLRPHLMETLYHLRQFYQLVIFTASEKSYADAILDIIDPLG
jgi:TFIIF-interacting CTD phosphatase-like protein